MRFAGAGMMGLAALALLAGCRQLFGIEEGRLIDAGADASSSWDADPTPDATPPECVPAPPGLVAWWRAEGNASDSWGDFDGTLVGGVDFGDGRVGEEFDFDGVNDAIRLDVENALYPDGSFSVETWIATTRASSAVVHRYECGGDSCFDALAAYALTVSDGKPAFMLRDSDGDGASTQSQTLVGPARIDDGSYHHVVAVRDVEAGEMRIIVDGDTVADAALGGGASDPIAPGGDGEDDPLVIGARWAFDSPPNPPFADFLLGQLDEISYYSRALTEEEAAEIVASGSAGKCR